MGREEALVPGPENGSEVAGDKAFTNGAGDDQQVLAPPTTEGDDQVYEEPMGEPYEGGYEEGSEGYDRSYEEAYDQPYDDGADELGDGPPRRPVGNSRVRRRRRRRLPPAPVR